MPTKTPPKASIDLSKKREQRVPKTLEAQRKAKANSGISPERTAEWWYERYLEQGLETGHWNIQKLPGWCQATGRLPYDAKVPHERTFLRWSSKFHWVEKRGQDMKLLTQRAREHIEEMIVLRAMTSYRHWMKTADDLEKQVALFLNAAEVYDEELGWVERNDPFAPEERPTRLRMRIPAKEYGGRGNPINHANLERLMNVALNVQIALPKLLPPGLQLEQQEEDQRGALTIVTPDKGQIAELSAGFGKLIEKLVERTEERRIERGLNVFGEKMEEPPALDAPGRDMLELDDEQGGSLGKRPDLWAAMVMRVAVTNFLRFEFSENGPPNVPEFGTANTEEGFRGLQIIDSYIKVRDGVHYPACLVTTGLNHPRVVVWQATKMAAPLQAATGSGKPILLRVENQGGHGINATKHQVEEEITDIFAFCFDQLMPHVRDSKE